MRLGACDAGTNRGVGRARGSCSQHDQGALRRNLGPLASRPEGLPHRRIQQPVLSREAAGSRVLDSGIHDRQALLLR